MSKLRGEDVIVGLGLEASDARGTRVAPQAWLAARVGSGITPVLDKVLVKETRGTKVASIASEMVKKRVEGDIEHNVRVQTIGYLLKSLLGQVNSTLKGGETVVYEHTFEVLLQDPQHPSMTVALSQPNVQDYDMPNGVATAMEITFGTDDLINSKTTLIAKTNTEQNTPYEPSFDDDDHYFRPFDAVIKIAANVAALGAADPLEVKEITLSLVNNGRPDYNIGDLTAADVLALVIEPTGSFMADIEDTDLLDVFQTGEYKAMSITMTRADVTIGNASNPKIQFIFPKVSFETWTPDRPIDEIATQNVEFQAHYDDTLEYAVKAIVTNKLPDYNPANESES